MAKCKIFPMEMVKCKIGCVLRKSVQIQSVHNERIITKKWLLLIRSLTFGKFSLKVGEKIWLPIYFQVSISFQILTEDADSDGDRDAQMKMMPIRGSENLAGAADRQAGVFLEAERPQRDCFLTIWPVTGVAVVSARGCGQI